jgi:hypothetical protein
MGRCMPSDERGNREGTAQLAQKMRNLCRNVRRNFRRQFKRHAFACWSLQC